MYRNDSIELTEDLLYGQGYHKKCYIHPKDSKLCVKIAYNSDGKIELKREIKYIKRLKSQKIDLSILPKYYYPVKTNLGIGHLYERIVNFDGSTCLTLIEYLENPYISLEEIAYIQGKLKQLEKHTLENRIITMGLFPHNMLVQEISANTSQLRLLNDIGSAALLPLEYYFAFLAKAKLKRRWARFYKRFHDLLYKKHHK